MKIDFKNIWNVIYFFMNTSYLIHLSSMQVDPEQVINIRIVAFWVRFLVPLDSLDFPD